MLPRLSILAEARLINATRAKRVPPTARITVLRQGYRRRRRDDIGFGSGRGVPSRLVFDQPVESVEVLADALVTGKDAIFNTGCKEIDFYPFARNIDPNGDTGVRVRMLCADTPDNSRTI
jgi:hypothetical protein